MVNSMFKFSQGFTQSHSQSFVERGQDWLVYRRVLGTVLCACASLESVKL